MGGSGGTGMHQILSGTRILPDNSAAGRTTAPTSINTRSRPTRGSRRRYRGRNPPINVRYA
jgi:hypothetical protein